MLNKNDKMHDYTNKFASNMYKLNKDINRVYKSLVHKIYHATTQRNSNKLHELQFQKINYNFKIKIYKKTSKIK